jgi:hypothetical protein
MINKPPSLWDLFVSFGELGIGDAIALLWKVFSQIQIKYVFSFIVLFIVLKLVLFFMRRWEIIDK